MKRFTNLLFVMLVGAPWITGAAPLCFNLFRKSAERAQIEQQVEHRLQPYLDQIPEKVSQKIVSKLSRKLQKQKVSEFDFHKLSLQYYEALNGPFYKNIFNRFSKVRSEEDLIIAESFYNALNRVTDSYSVTPRDNMWIRMRLKLIDAQVPFSILKTVAAQAAVMWGTYQFSGQIVPIPVYIPTWQSLKFSNSLTAPQVTSIFYNKALKSLHAGITAVTLASMVLLPGEETEVLNAAQESVTNFEKEQNELIRTNKIMTDTTDLEKRTNALTADVDAFIAAQEAAKQQQK